jgi:hypothetical protein
MALTFLQNKYLDELEDYYDTHGKLPPKENLNLRMFAQPEFRKGLKYRGLPTPENVPLNGLTPVQKSLINSIANYSDRRPIRKKLEEHGLSMTEYKKLLKNELFVEKLSRAVDEAFTTETSLEAKIGLSRLIQEADLGAIKYFHEFTGQWKPNEVTALNLTMILAKLMEILVTYLDPAVLPEVADKLEAVVIETTTSELPVSSGR